MILLLNVMSADKRGMISLNTDSRGCRGYIPSCSYAGNQSRGLNSLLLGLLNFLFTSMNATLYYPKLQSKNKFYEPRIHTDEL